MALKRIRCFVLTIGWIVSLNSLGLAAPVVTTISGPMSHGSTITITGLGFGTKSSAKPLIWADFESSLAPSNLGIVTSWSSTSNMTQSTDCPSGQCAKSNQSGGCGACTLGFNYLGSGRGWSTEGLKFYVYRRSKMNFQITTGSQNWKILRVWSEAPAVNPINLYVASNNGRIFVENVGFGDGYLDPGFWADGLALAIPANAWTVEEFIFQASTGTATDGSLKILHNGVVKAAGTLRTRTASSDPLERMYPVHHVSANGGTWNPAYPGGDGIIGWADDVYVDTSWQRVMVCAQSTWAACTNKAIQIPSAWSDTAISVTLNKGPLSGLVGSYLYVIDVNGGVNAQGFPLCTGDCPPSPPQNIRVQ